MNAIVRSSVLLLAGFTAVTLPAQPAPQGDSNFQTSVRIDSPKGRLGWLTRPYKPRYIPPVNLGNSSRIASLIKGGNLYLSAQDVIALALENNIDIEVQRYGPLLAREVLRRTEGGGLLRSVGQGVSAGPVSVTLSGVTINTNGAPSGISSGVSSNVVTGLGPAIPSFDPTITALANFQHSTTPQSNTIIVGTTAFIDDVRTYQFQYTQNFHFGMN